MAWEAWVTLAVVATAVVVLARDLVAPSLTLLSSVVVLLVAGVLTPAQAFAGFSNPAPITVAALYVLAGAVEKTGGLQPLVTLILDGARNQRRALARLLVPTAGASAFLNNTPIVAMLLPQVSAWAERSGRSPSLYLMPLSFASILGGMVTLIGTSTNIVVSGLLEADGQRGFGMFELTRAGLPAALIGIGVLILLAPRMLRGRKTPSERAAAEVREFVVSMRVVPGGPMEGRTAAGAGLRALQGLYLAEIERERELIAPVAPDHALRGGDRLTFVGRADMVVELQRMRGLVSVEQRHMLPFDAPSHTFFEAVIGEASPLVGSTLKEADFRRRYQAAVLAIHRAGKRVQTKFGDVRLKVGDTLLLLADDGFRDRWRERSDFLLVAVLGGSPPIAGPKAALVGAVGFAIIATAATGLLPILHAALAGALLLIGFRVLSAREARGAINVDVIIVIAAAFGLGTAVHTTGLAAGVADVLVGGFGVLGPAGALLGLALTTLLLTELVTNNAAAVLAFPIAMAVAAATGLDPRGGAVIVALVASASFLTPIGYQTNTMVYGPGGYRFGDYTRLGAAVSLTVVATVVAMVWWIWGP